MRLLANATLPVTPWPNGAGRKADIAAGDGWMLGFAWLDRDAAFSDLQGLDRTITLVAGPGFDLDIAGRDTVRVREPFVPTSFDGGAPTLCRVEGPCRVLNVMTRRGRYRHGIALTSLPARCGPASVASWAVLLRGTASLVGDSACGMQALDALGVDAAIELTGSPDALLAQVTIQHVAPSG